MGNRSKAKTSHRRLAALTMAQLYRLAMVHREAGEALDADAWLKVAANILSSAPPGAEGSRRNGTAPLTFGLSEQSLTLAAIRVGLDFSPGRIEAQVAHTLDWRASEAKLAGKPVYRPMRPDTIGRLLGVTEETRREAEAWLIGTFDGSRKDRAEAYRQREAERRRRDRAEAGARPRCQSDARLKPWEAAGISRAGWYRAKAKRIETNSFATNGGRNSHAHVETVSSATVSSATNKERETNSSATNKRNIDPAATASGLASTSRLENAADEVSSDEWVERLQSLRFEPAPAFRLQDAKPDGLIVRALTTVCQPPRVACKGQTRRREAALVKGLPKGSSAVRPNLNPGSQRVALSAGCIPGLCDGPGG